MTHWRVLAAVGAMNWSGYFIYDIPASLSTSLEVHLSLPNNRFAYLVSLLYTVYAVPNTVLPFFSGAAVQRFGERRVLLLTALSTIIGQLLFALAIQTKSQLGLIVGRACIGLGGEIVSVIGVDIITQTFQDRRLSQALAINIGAGRLGSIANAAIVPNLIGPYGIVSATWTATGLVIGFTATGLISLLIITRPKCLRDDEDPLLAEVGGRNTGTVPLSFRQLPPVFWQLVLICVLSFGCLSTFTNSAQRFLAMRFYNGNQRAAGSAMSASFILSGLLVPPFGVFLDKLSSSSYPRALTTANVFLALAHAFFLYRAVQSPVLPLSLLSVADALMGVSFWASVAKCLRPGSVAEAAREHEPLFKNKSGDDCHTSGYETLTAVSSSETLVDNVHSQTDGDKGLNMSTANPGKVTAAVCNENMTTLGLGVMSSLMNISMAVVPLPLAVMENFAGFEGLEGVFLVLALLGCAAGARLVWTN